MEYLNKKLPPARYLLALAGFLIIFLTFFSFTFGFHHNVDTDGFIYSIQLFRGEDAELYAQRYLNPLYPVVASKVLFFLSPVHALVVLNVLFCVGVAFFTFGLIRRVFQNDLIAIMSSLLIASAYPMVRYALTQVQDLGGYFWFVSTLYFSWRWYKEKFVSFLIIASITTAFGLLTKESGAMGALFFAVLLLLDRIAVCQKVKYFLLFSLAPFITLVINKMRGADVNYDSVRWFIDNWHIYYQTHYTLFKWAGVNASTYNILWIPFFIGLFKLVKDSKLINRDIIVYLIAIIPGSISYLAWPLFISRTVFISAWFVVPIACYALYQFYEKGGLSKICAICFFGVLLVSPSVLQYTLRYAHVFTIYEDCKKNISCSWNYFWKHRSEFKTEF